MQFLVQFFVGIIVGVYGYLSPSIINIQIFRISTSNERRHLQWIILLISLIEIPYCVFCMLAFKWFLTFALLQIILQWAIVVLLLVMSFYIFLNAKKSSFQNNNSSEIQQNFSIKSLLLFALLNPFQWSAWSIWSAYFIEKKWFFWTVFGIGIFSLGAFIGTYIILSMYALVGKKWMQIFSNHKQNIDYGIALLLLILAIIQVLKIFLN